MREADLDRIVAGLSEFARAGAYAMQEALLATDGPLKDNLFDVVERLPWEGGFDPDNAVQRNFVIGAISAAAGFALARGERDWFERLRGAYVAEPALKAFLTSLLAEGSFDPEGPGVESRFWALEAIRKPALAPSDLIVASVRVWEWLGDTIWSRELAEATCPAIVRHWLRVAAEARFALLTPASTAPAIEAAARAASDRVGLGRLILAVFEGLRVRPSPDLLSAIHGQPQDPTRASDAFAPRLVRQKSPRRAEMPGGNSARGTG